MSMSASSSDVKQSHLATKPPRRRGVFLLFEGPDRAGKSTQCAKLVACLNKPTGAVLHMAFPNRTTPIGKLIDDILKHKTPPLDDHAMHLLFSANRWECMQTIRYALEAGTHVIMDRYSFSGVAYSNAKGLQYDWCKAADAGLIAPDVVFYMQLKQEDASKRAGYGQECLETNEIQTHVSNFFDAIACDSHWHRLDATRGIDDLHEHIVSIANKSIKMFQDDPIRVMDR